jgi:hypothetical protein
MAASPRPIPPSSGTKQAVVRNASDGAYSPKSKKRRGAVHSSSWLWLNGVCLFINIGLMVTLFIFHANWMPRQTNMVIKSHLKNRKEIWKLMAGKKTGTEAEKVDGAGEDEEQLDSGNLGGKSYSGADLPYSLGNSPNNDDYDISKQQYHVIFSTGCSDKQHWQSYMLYYSMVTSEQTGQVTRIASGCTKEEEDGLAKIHQEQIVPMGMDMPYNGKSRFHLHMTPEFGSGFHYNK